MDWENGSAYFARIPPIYTGGPWWAHGANGPISSVWLSGSWPIFVQLWVFALPRDVYITEIPGPLAYNIVGPAGLSGDVSL